jgi:hypothetical protein
MGHCTSFLLKFKSIFFFGETILFFFGAPFGVAVINLILHVHHASLATVLPK